MAGAPGVYQGDFSSKSLKVKGRPSTEGSGTDYGDMWFVCHHLRSGWYGSARRK